MEQIPTLPHIKDHMKNDHELSREIPSEIKREVRKRCGFGCVVCGSAIYEYEHFDPEFKDAKEHIADGIALLCPTDHRRKEKKLLSREKYLEAIANPKAFETNKAYTDWEDADFAPTIFIGNKIFKGGTSILKIDIKSKEDNIVNLSKFAFPCIEVFV